MDLIGIVRIGACVERRLGFELTTRCGASADPTIYSIRVNTSKLASLLILVAADLRAAIERCNCSTA
jgi:hypothetical protein